MRSVAILGGGKFGRQLARLLRGDFSDRFSLRGFVDDTMPEGVNVEGDGDTLGGWDRFTSIHRPGEVELVLAVGYADLDARRRVFDRARQAGYRFATLVHPQAIVAPDAQIDEGAIVMAGAVIDGAASVGAGTFLDIGALVCERVRLGRLNYVSAGVAIGGDAVIGEANFIGLNATVVDDVSIGDGNRVQVGAVVHRNVGDRSTVMEARSIRIIPQADDKQDAA